MTYLILVANIDKRRYELYHNDFTIIMMSIFFTDVGLPIFRCNIYLKQYHHHHHQIIIIIIIIKVLNSSIWGNPSWNSGMVLKLANSYPAWTPRAFQVDFWWILHAHVDTPNSYTLSLWLSICIQCGNIHVQNFNTYSIIKKIVMKYL